MADKSVLDNVPVDDKAFPLKSSGPVVLIPSNNIVGQCPRCGSPIYGKWTCVSGEDPQVVRSCPCRFDESAAQSNPLRTFGTNKEEGGCQASGK